MVADYVPLMSATTRAASVRVLGRADAPRLAMLSARLGAESLADWVERLARPDCLVVGAEVGGRLVGYAAGDVRRTIGRASPTAWVISFAVDLEHRGRGTGRDLATALLDHLRASGADHVVATVPLHDRELDPFFRGLGFRDEPVICLGKPL